MHKIILNSCIVFLISLLMPTTLISASDFDMHPKGAYVRLHQLTKRSLDDFSKTEQKNHVEEFSSDYWLRNGQEGVRMRLARKVNENIAKNVILFLGDGMSIPTLAATRNYLGGEEKELSFEKFPYTALSKTYCVDNQVADSACSATAYLTGVKANYGTIGVTASVPRQNCTATHDASTTVWSLAHYAQQAGKATGLVTTARVTHASPAGVYAHTAERDWECDTDILEQLNTTINCPDIAQQLIFNPTGSRLDVVFGGGRAKFYPQTQKDHTGNIGNRSDGLNLIKEYLNADKGAQYIWNRQQLVNLQPKDVGKIMGLFSLSHMSYNLHRNISEEPSLKEMTLAAINVLKEKPNGYFLFVEGAKIDMAHHLTMARNALEETAEFSRAVQAAVDATSEDDTLIVVTADHAHTMSFSGYSERGEDVLGIAGVGEDKVPYSVLSYANGPGFKPNDENGKRHDITLDNMTAPDYQFPGLVPIKRETHGGDDVGIFARGPWSHLFTGVMEQNIIPHLMGFAMCLQRGDLRTLTACDLSSKEA